MQARLTLNVACAQLRALPVQRAREALSQILAAIKRARRAGAEFLVLPECSYPGYVLLDPRPYGKDIPSDSQALAVISREVRRHKLTCVVGIARTYRAGTVRNEAVLLDHNGEEIGSYAKMRLWNFDHRWFRPGRSLPVYQTKFGTIGMMICADGRNPEIARTLAAKGAWLIADPTAWVGFGPSPEGIYNVQAEYMLRTRSLENGVWIAAADKCGSELGAVHYAGRSQIAAPDGRVIALADSARPQLVSAEVRKSKPAPFVAVLSDADRGTLRRTAPANSFARRAQSRRAATAASRFWLAVYQSPASGRDDPLALQAMKAQGPAATLRTGQSAQAMARELKGVRDLRFALISGKAMAAPEPARAAALRGAALLVWLAPPKGLPLLNIARTRAVENRVYVCLAARSNAAVPASLINPDGSIGGSALGGESSGFVSAIDLVAARRKEIVPGTQTFADGTPSVYHWLDRARGPVRA
jgi:predicted amidohydrolase